MIPYSDFHLSDLEIEKLKQSNARLAISEYIKLHGHAPSDISSFYTCTAKDIERRRRAWYAHYLTITSYNSESDSENEENAGNNNENNDNENNDIEYITLNYNICDIKIEFPLLYDGNVIGNAPYQFDREVRKDFMRYLSSGEPIDSTCVDIRLRNKYNTGEIHITNLSETIEIPEGVYYITGYIGRSQNQENKTCCYQQTKLTVDTYINYDGSSKLTIPFIISDAIIMCGCNFRIKSNYQTYNSDTGVNSAGDNIAQPSNLYIGHRNYYYAFLTNEFINNNSNTRIYDRTFIFDVATPSIEYTIFSTNLGKFYYFNPYN